MRGLADQWPGWNSIYQDYIHPVLWIGYLMMRQRSKRLIGSL